MKPKKRYIPPQLKVLHPDLSLTELRSIINHIINNKTQVLTQSEVFNVRLKGLGTLRTHKSKLPKNINKTRANDRKKKQAIRKKESLTKEKLLW